MGVSRNTKYLNSFSKWLEFKWYVCLPVVCGIEPRANAPPPKAPKAPKAPKQRNRVADVRPATKDMNPPRDDPDIISRLLTYPAWGNEESADDWLITSGFTSRIQPTRLILSYLKFDAPLSPRGRNHSCHLDARYNMSQKGIGEE